MIIHTTQCLECGAEIKKDFPADSGPHCARQHCAKCGKEIGFFISQYGNGRYVVSQE